MSQVLVNYDQIFGDITSMRREIQSEIIQMQTSYQQCQHALTAMDGGGNFAIREAMVANMEKARVTADTLEKLLIFINDATREAQELDRAMGRVLDMSQLAQSVRKRVTLHA